MGTANIARKNWQAIRNAPNCTLTAVASRDLDRCRRFIGECQRHVAFDPPPLALGSYEELLASDAVDAVYIPLPTGVRKPWAIRAAEAGKHVLVEKPVGATSQDVREILAACRQSGVQFMDGVMFMHSRRMESMRKILADGHSIGPLKRITSQFTFGGRKRVFHEQHPRPQPARAARLSWRFGLVQHPLHSVGDELGTAGKSRRPHPGRTSPPG